MVSQARLARLYRELNRRWFRGRLSARPTLTFARLGHLGASYGGALDIRACPGGGLCVGPSPVMIRLNARLRFSLALTATTLLHEMAHLATFDERARHGPRWRREMRRLLRAGAYDEWL